MERRELLEQVGVAAGVSVAGLGSIVTVGRIEGDHSGLTAEGKPRESPRPEVPSRYEEEFETVVDAVSAGADPTGREPIDDVLATHADGGVLIAFEPGTYRLGPLVLSDLSTFGIVGIGEERPTFRPAEAACRPGVPYLSFDGVDQFVLEDVDFQHWTDTNGGPIQLFASGDAAVRNVRLVGDCPEQIAAMRVEVVEEGATGIVENLVAVDDVTDSKLTGVYVGKRHAGTLRFLDCEIRGYSDNGLYASSPGQPDGNDGSVEVLGGTFTDNNIANVRLGSTGSIARNVTIDVRSPRSPEGSVNARGIRLRARSDHVVENCDITIAADSGGSFGGIVFHPDAGGAVIRDTSIDVDADSVVGIKAFEPTDADVPGPVVENVSITGRAATGYAANVEGRNGTVFRNCTIEQNGYDRGGIRLANATDCEIVDSEITTTGAPVELRQARASVENTTIATPNGTRTIDSLDARNEVLTP